MTGTPLDLTPFGGLLAALGWAYWALALGIIGVALWLPKAWWLKLTLAAFVTGAVVYPKFVLPIQKRAEELRQAQAEYNRRLAAATAHFEMRCKSSGETIKQRVENVDGVVWLKWRDEPGVLDDYDQFKLSDPFGRDCKAEGCIEQLLTLPAQGGRFEREVSQRKDRYRWVESVDPGDGKKYRYVGAMKPRPMWTEAAIRQLRKETGEEIGDDSYWFKTDRQPIARYTARYGVTWDDISTREDREHWIAGGSLQIIDLQTNEVIAQRIGYMMDRGLGDRSGFRNPWAYARQYTCPQFPQIGKLDVHPRRSFNETSDFVTNVLKSTRE